ncbi:MAG: DUF1573 domain-containing protein [Clostridiaceae bacterium]|nr:DUF1573 domain-containing protein [Clostridiaceae bacterium]
MRCSLVSENKNTVLDEFQRTSNELLIRNKNILDSMTKMTDSCARVSRTLVKAATHCGCIKIIGDKQQTSGISGMDEMKQHMKSQVKGSLCGNCRDLLEKEIGRNLFYLAAICNALDLNLYDILTSEMERVKLLGKYSLR